MSLLDLLKAKKQDMAASRRRKTIKPVEGTSRYRILPSWRGEGQQFWHDFGQHYVKNAAKEISAIYMCTDKTFGKPCAVCDAIKQGMKAATDDHTMEILKDALSAGRILLNVLHLDGATPGEVQILELPPTVFDMLIQIAEEWEAAGDSVFDTTPGKGKDIMITRTGTGKNTKYTVQVGAKVTPIPGGVLEKLHDLDAYVAQESAEQQLRALNSVRSVSGLLPAPAAASTSTSLATAGAATIEEDDPYAVATPPKRAAAPAADVVDVAPKPAAKPAPAAAAAPVKPAAAPAAVVESTGDPELDKMLADLG